MIRYVGKQRVLQWFLRDKSRKALLTHGGGVGAEAVGAPRSSWTPTRAAGQEEGVGFRLVTIREKNQTQRGEASLACGPWRSAWRVSTRPPAPDWKVRRASRGQEGQAVTDRARGQGVRGSARSCPAEHREEALPLGVFGRKAVSQGRDRTPVRGVSLPLIPCVELE